jgi:hypothetical protein
MRPEAPAPARVADKVGVIVSDTKMLHDSQRMAYFPHGNNAILSCGLRPNNVIVQLLGSHRRFISTHYSIRPPQCKPQGQLFHPCYLILAYILIY